MIYRLSVHLGDGRHRIRRFYMEKSDADFAASVLTEQESVLHTVTVVGVDEVVSLANDLLERTPANASDAKERQ